MTRLVGFDERTATRIARQTRRWEQMPNRQVGPNTRYSGLANAITAKITGVGATSGHYTATEQIYDRSAEAFIDLVGIGRDWDDAGSNLPDLIELTGNASVPINTIVAVYPIGDDEKAIQWVFAYEQVASPIRVTYDSDDSEFDVEIDVDLNYTNSDRISVAGTPAYQTVTKSWEFTEPVTSATVIIGVALREAGTGRTIVWRTTDGAAGGNAATISDEVPYDQSEIFPTTFYEYWTVTLTNGGTHSIVGPTTTRPTLAVNLDYAATARLNYASGLVSYGPFITHHASDTFYSVAVPANSDTTVYFGQLGSPTYLYALQLNTTGYVWAVPTPVGHIKTDGSQELISLEDRAQSHFEHGGKSGQTTVDGVTIVYRNGHIVDIT